MPDFEFVHLDVREGVAAITLNRPPLNVLHIPMMRELNTALEPLIDHPDVAAIVFRAVGKAFCAGVDVADHTADRIADMLHDFHGIFRKLAATDALTVAAVHGAALGGGCELACFCDVVLAGERAKFGQPEVLVGCFPPVAASVLPLKIGLGRSVELTVTGRTLDAAEAARFGLAGHVFPSDSFDVRVEEYLAQVRRLSRPVVRLAKRAAGGPARRLILEHLEAAERLYLDELMKLQDAHEGVAAFLAKRPPVWRHG